MFTVFSVSGHWKFSEIEPSEISWCKKKQFDLDYYGFVENSRHFDQMFTIGEQTYIVGWWQIFGWLIAANKYLTSQIFSPANNVHDRILSNAEYLLVNKDFLATSSHHHICATSTYYSLKIRSRLSYPRQNVQIRHGWFFPAENWIVFTNGKYLQKDKILHVSVDWKIDLQVVKEWGVELWGVFW